ncbi:MAG: DUF5348 domain-containing protein [Bdellovibrionales bacterium]
MKIQGELKKNYCDRYQFRDVVLTSGSVVELRIGGHWIPGCVECVHQSEPPFLASYYWFSSKDKVPVQLRAGLLARLTSY